MRRRTPSLRIWCLTAALFGQLPIAAEIVVFGDVHGAYRELTQILSEQRIIDEEKTWRAGSLQLVSLGDLIDRGDDGRAVLDLLMRLQPQANASAGQLHVVLGNHEIMNLVGELKYVSGGDYAQFAADESAAVREAAFVRMRAAGRFESLGDVDAHDRFAAAFPPGFFARLAAFAPDGQYGQWLLDQSIVLHIEDTLFVHGGLPPILAQESAAELSARLIDEVGAYARAWHSALDAGLVDPDTPVADRVALATQRRMGAEHQLIVDTLARHEHSIAFTVDGPAWYRGQALCHPGYEDDVLTAALRRQNAARVVVGHTVNPQGRVVSRFGGRVVLADSGMLKSVYRGRAALVYLRDSGVSVAYVGEPDRKPPLDDPVLVGQRPGAIDDTELGAQIRVSELVADNSMDDGRRAVKLTIADNQTVDATLLPARRLGPWQSDRELAAYQLDRLLDLRLIPATVERSTERSHPVAQYVPIGATTHAERTAGGDARQGWCPLQPQYDLMAAFDGLIGLAVRDPRTIAYTANDPMLLLTGHGGAFGTSKQLPSYLRKARFLMSSSMVARLKALDESSLSAALHWLNPRQVSALLARRDALLALQRSRSDVR